IAHLHRAVLDAADVFAPPLIGVEAPHRGAVQVRDELVAVQAGRKLDRGAEEAVLTRAFERRGGGEIEAVPLAGDAQVGGARLRVPRDLGGAQRARAADAAAAAARAAARAAASLSAGAPVTGGGGVAAGGARVPGGRGAETIGGAAEGRR